MTTQSAIKTTTLSYPTRSANKSDHLIVTITKSSLPKTPPELINASMPGASPSHMLFDADPYDVLHSQQLVHSPPVKSHPVLINPPSSLSMDLNHSPDSFAFAEAMAADAYHHALFSKPNSNYFQQKRLSHAPIITDPAEYPNAASLAAQKSSAEPLSASTVRTAYPTPTSTTPASPVYFGNSTIPQTFDDEHYDDGKKLDGKSVSAPASINDGKERRKSRSIQEGKHKSSRQSSRRQEKASSQESPVTQAFAKSTLYKTEMCRSWEETGNCRYGNKCQFAHSTDEVRPVDRHPKYKTEMCRTFWEKGACPYGKRCCFIHTDKDLFEKKNGIGAVPPNLSAAISPSRHAMSAIPASCSPSAHALASFDQKASPFPEMLPPVHTIMLKDSSSDPTGLDIRSPPRHSSLTAPSLLSKSPLGNVSKSASSMESLWNMPRVSPFSRSEDAFKSAASLGQSVHAHSMLSSSMDNYPSAHHSGLERSFQSMSLTDQMHVPSPYSRNLHSFNDEPHGLKGFDTMTGHSRMMSSNAALSLSSGMRNSSSYYTPQFQSSHRFRMDSHSGGPMEELFWGDPIFHQQSGHQMHGNPDSNMMNHLPGDLLNNSHQRTFSSPAHSLMYDNMEHAHGSSGYGHGLHNPHHPHTTSTSLLMGGARGFNGLGR